MNATAKRAKAREAKDKETRRQGAHTTLLLRVLFAHLRVFVVAFPRRATVSSYGFPTGAAGVTGAFGAAGAGDGVA
jgi:hypothetical protein